MSYNLKAVLSLKDEFSSPMQKIERQVSRSKKTMDQLSGSTAKMGSATTRAANSQAGFSKSIGGLTRGLGGLKTALFGAVAGYAAYEGAKKVFESTVGTAMEREVSAITIDTMFDTEKASRAYQKMMKEMALDSPVLSFGDMAGGSKRVLALTQDMEVLEKVWKNVEKLQAFAPDKSTDDAIRGIAELASGDYVSLKEVFNLDKTQLDALKNLSFEDQVAGLDKMLQGMRITDDLIEKVGGTTSAKLNQVKEKFEDIFARIGAPSLDVMSGFFDNILSRLEGEGGDKFAAVGGRMINGILTGLTNGAIGIYDWFTALTASEEFKEKTTVYGKVSFVIGDIYEKFLEWLNEGGGKKKIEDTTSVLLQSIASAIDTSLPVLLPIALKVGKSIGDGIVKGFNDAVADSFVLSALGGPQHQQKYAKKKGNGIVSDLITDKFKDHLRDRGKDKESTKKKGGAKSHNGGLGYVPYNGYQANLHRGEQVLTRGEADAYRKGSGGNTINLTLNYTPGTDSKTLRQQAQELMGYFADEIEASGMAGAYNGG